MRNEDNILTELNKIKYNISDFKATQKVSGDSFINYAISSSSDYDFSVTMDTTNKTYRLTFTQDTPDKYNIIDLSLFMRVDNSNVMADPRVSNATPYTSEICFEAPQLGVTTWLIDCANLDYSTFPNVNTHTFYYKFYFNGTATGTFSAQLI